MIKKMSIVMVEITIYRFKFRKIFNLNISRLGNHQFTLGNR